MKFCVKITKQDSKSHVIFTSSDSFFEKWMIDNAESESQQYPNRQL